MTGKPRPSARKPHPAVWIAAGAGAAVFLALVVARVFFIATYRIPQNGMYPGLPAGSFLVSRKNPYPGAGSVDRGDIIIFNRTENGDSYTYIWRVIALPGETVETSGGDLAIDGHPVRRQRVDERDGLTIFREQIGDASYEIALDESPRREPPSVSVEVPAGHFFVMGDNRFGAADSRYFGAVPFEAIVGRKL